MGMSFDQLIPYDTIPRTVEALYLNGHEIHKNQIHMEKVIGKDTEICIPRYMIN